MNSRLGTIYYIVGKGINAVKIGFTAGCPQKRLKALQTGSPTKLVLMAYHPGTLADEKRLHAELANHRKHGEWFHWSYEMHLRVAHVCVCESKRFMDKGLEPPEWALVGSEVFFTCVDSAMDGAQIQI